ncbi:RNA polymerase sigma (SigV) subunit [Brevibacillus sp. AG162]|uniref:sigma-70 family RNA polymerase sigma factor n=1 Tax=Brevibacillus sp. AG162 TaxID=2572910 RepID=UPI00114FBFFF|nr:sigma-70 family RNA polymerase sigma factor [Brevibacillus sp. AG162]TQK62481.1 RNA polymerase sigma (SigV) subunit [Brevibacillus sp. AG162]
MNIKLGLVARAKAGDSDAFQMLIHQEKANLYKMAFVYTRNEDDALEVFQETVYKALISISTLKDDQYVTTWLTRVLINTAIAYLAKKRKVISLRKDMIENVRDTGSVRLEERIDLLEAMEELEEKYVTVLLLRFYKDYSVKQIAETLDCPEGTVKTNIHRGLTLLKKKLKGEYFDERKNSCL